MLVFCGADEQSTILSHVKIECNFVDRFLPVVGMLTKDLAATRPARP